MDLKSMSVEELQEILRKDAELSKESDSEFTLAVLDELAARTGKGAGDNADAAWERFLRYYIPVEATTQQSHN